MVSGDKVFCYEAKPQAVTTVMYVSWTSFPSCRCGRASPSSRSGLLLLLFPKTPKEIDWSQVGLACSVRRYLRLLVGRTLSDKSIPIQVLMLWYTNEAVHGKEFCRAWT